MSAPLPGTQALHLRAVVSAVVSEKRVVGTKSSPTYQVEINRQKAAQAAGNYELSDLPGGLAQPDAAARLGKAPEQDKVLAGGRSLSAVAKLSPRAGMAVYGRPESRWATAYYRRVGGSASMVELLSYARQLIGMDPEGNLAVCLCGHAGQGPCIPLWAPRSELSLTVQPNDLVLRFDTVCEP